jgi:outer membrane lipase/esterase
MQTSGAMKVWCRGLRVLPWLLLAWLASCGGGTTQIEPFRPRQIILIGDETVGLLPDGRRYGINGVDANNVLECGQLPIWSQQLTANFGFTTDFCGGGTTGVTRAAANAKAADIEGQISDQIVASGGITSKDLFVLMVGMNDIIELYETFTGDRSCNESDQTPPPNSLTFELRARGHAAALQINRIINEGGRVIVSTVHDLGYAPYARTREGIAPGTMALLSCMTAVFNARVRVDPLQDGRFWGLVLADDATVAMVTTPSSFGVANVFDAACAVASPGCTTNTLNPGAGTTYLWADDRHFGPLMHNQLANQAITRARNNPF